MMTPTEQDAQNMITRCKCDRCVRGVKNWRGFSICKFSLHPSTCGKYQVNKQTLISNAEQAFK